MPIPSDFDRPANLDSDTLYQQAGLVYNLAMSADRKNDETEYRLLMGVAHMLFMLSAKAMSLSVKDTHDNLRIY